MGTGFLRANGDIKEQRPAPIRHAHIQAYRNREAINKGHLSLVQIQDLWEVGEILHLHHLTA